MKAIKPGLIFFLLIQASVSFSRDYLITDYGAQDGGLSTQAIR